MPPKKQIPEMLLELRQHVEHNVARLALRPGDSVRENLEQLHKGDKRFYQWRDNNELYTSSDPHLVECVTQKHSISCCSVMVTRSVPLVPESTYPP